MSQIGFMVLETMLRAITLSMATSLAGKTAGASANATISAIKYQPCEIAWTVDKVKICKF
jgi:hypothetical protein